MGTVGSTEVKVMKRLVDILAKSKHKFIVSKGSKHEEFELAENMWGEASIPQLDILPLVDLVIFHGGNNTFTEAVYFGKPMIVMPLFGDQPDNAQLVVEAKIGFKLNLFTVTEKELLSAIDTLVEDKQIQQRVKSISEEIRANSNLDVVVERIEYVAQNPKFPTVFESH
ncbi:UDP-glucuronosyltransferase-like protein 3 [Dinothrombium tinctorium]|uniref:UDP-glucuronosyltransferase-like protein 3 n=1 Tax=Dinothrombium tinctorium TaxID=1965070 RepID=A0A3S3NAX5_9ACAR|nr:UDP-glucuronosyltransferase-like protein 3 [Dinothrombium tinctorium]